MEFVKNYNIRDRTKIAVLLKFFTFIFLILNLINDWVPQLYICKAVSSIFCICTLGNILDMKLNEYSPLNINYNRLLAKHELGKELRHTSLREKLSDNNMYNRKKNVAENVSKYSQIKRIESYNFDAYMKDYKRRYGEKKGLYKLDCYCEKKLFNKIHHIDEISHRFENDNKRFKKFFLRKYGIGLIFFALIPALGLILPILFGFKNWGRGILSICQTSSHYSGTDRGGCTQLHPNISDEAFNNIELFHHIFSFIMIIVVFIVIIYILIKFIKYEKLKTGKRKLKIK